MKIPNNTVNKTIHLRELPEQRKISYYYYAPKKIDTILVLVHGISRNAKEIISEFSKHADKYNCLLIAPSFLADFATDYQRLGRIGKGPRSDYQLMSMIKDCQKLLNLANEIETFNLFGFSAGAQYAHRFAFAHPNLVNKVALVAAGWYTLPTTSLPYPRGTRIKKQFTDVKFYPNRYLRTKFRLFIGSLDDKRDEALNKNPKIDLTQGRNRISRAINWIDMMHLQMEKRKINNVIQLEKLEGADHDFINCVNKAQLDQKVMKWIFGV